MDGGIPESLDESRDKHRGQRGTLEECVALVRKGKKQSNFLDVSATESGDRGNGYRLDTTLMMRPERIKLHRREHLKANDSSFGFVWNASLYLQCDEYDAMHQTSHQILQQSVPAHFSLDFDINLDRLLFYIDLSSLYHM